LLTPKPTGDAAAGPTNVLFEFADRNSKPVERAKAAAEKVTSIPSAVKTGIEL